MPEKKKYKSYTSEDIEKYHKGLLSPAEMHDLEKAALDDPFLSDALEGYSVARVDSSADLAELEKKLEERIKGSELLSIAPRNNRFRWWKVAAAIVIIGGLGFLTFKISTVNKDDSSIAKVQEKKTGESGSVQVIDSNSIPKKETTHVAVSSKPVERSVGKAVRKITDSVVANGAISQDDEPSVITKETAPAGFELQQQNSDSINIQKSARGDVAPLANVKKLKANNDKQTDHLVSLSESVGGTEQEQMKYYHGRVVDANNNPLPFANITSTHYNVGTYADAEGNFTLISGDSVLDVQVRSVGFENNLARLKNNVVTNKVILEEDKATPDRIISFRKPDTSRSRNGSMKAEEPEPADGWTNYSTYLANNINVPDDLKTKTDKGQVKLSFDVNQEGEAVNIKVEKKLCAKCDEEAIRLIKQGPKWKKTNKKAKKVTITVPFDTPR